MDNTFSNQPPDPKNQKNPPLDLIYFKVEINLPDNLAWELYGKILSKEPTLDPYFTDNGLALVFSSPSKETLAPFWEGHPIPAHPFKNDHTLDPLAFLKNELKDILKNKPLPPIEATWLPSGVPRSFDLKGFLGPLSLVSEPHEAKEPTLGAFLKIPPGLRLSPCRQEGFSQIVGAMADFFTPPPGAPDTRGDQSLVIAPSPVLPLAALAYGANPVTFLYSFESQPSAKDLGALNGYENLYLKEFNPRKLTKNPEYLPQEAFNLIAVVISPSQAVRLFPLFFSWLKVHGRLIVGGLCPGISASMVLKAALKSGLSLLNSSFNSKLVTLTFQKYPYRQVEFWNWEPGDWLAELNEDELRALEEASLI
ncbi:MAG: hypothetical protein LBF22_12610 [Deltaproteobacteria bacterium]|jgi:hypothetical protein|nr:hypothetical protein [Deltaproteobacteria bacterium]